MPSPPVPLHTRIRGTAAFTAPAVNASSITLGKPVAGQAYMVYPAAENDLIWQGGEFGLSAPPSGGLTANVWQVAVTIGHFCSGPASFSSVTAEIYDTNTSTVIASQPFTLSSTLITETITLTTGYPAADVPDLAVRLVWHQVAVGYANVQHAYADISYSYSDSVGSLTIDPIASMGVPAVSVTPLPPVDLVAAGAVALSFTPLFGQPTAAGDLLLAWVYSNSSSSTFGTTCPDPSWSLAAHAGAAYGWESLWYRLDCGHAETPPTFADTGYSEPMSQLLEFSGVYALDQVAPGSGTEDITYTASSPDTASGDLVFGFCAWNGSNTGATTITLSGQDSSGAALVLTQADNHAGGVGPGSTQYWVTGWAQAAAPAGPDLDTMTATIGFFAGGGGVMASFKPLAAALASPSGVPSRVMGGRVVTVTVFAGRR